LPDGGAPAVSGATFFFQAAMGGTGRMGNGTAPSNDGAPGLIAKTQQF
jgi:hypothetical protein